MYTIGGCGTELAPPLANPTGGVSDFGLGCVDCGGGCGMSGLTMDGSGLFGSGIFGTGVSLTDFSTWSVFEIATLAVGAYALYSVAFTTRHTARRARVRVTKIKKGFTS